MTRVLVSFLGGYRATDPAKGGAAGGKSYDDTEYLFVESNEVHPSAWSAAALLQHLRGQGQAPDRLVVLGTSGSFWDTLLLAPSLGDDPAVLALYEEVEAACARDAFTPAMAEACRAPLSAHFGCAVEAHVMPYGRNRAEQLAMLHQLRACVPRGGRLQLDVTHSLRHLPLLATIAAALLRGLHDVTVEAVWYGAAELRRAHRGQAPMLRLDALVEVVGWLEALAALKATANPGQLLAPLRRSAACQQAGVALDRAAHQMSLFRVGEAVVEARRALADWPRDDVAGLFRAEVQQRLAWIEGGDEPVQLALLARMHLAHGDFLRALLAGYEAVVRSLPSPYGDHWVWQDPGVRALTAGSARKRTLAARKAFLEDEEWRRDLVTMWRADVGKAPPTAKHLAEMRSALRDLTALRNAIAHTDEDVASATEALLRDERALRGRVSAVFDLLLPR